MKRKTISRLIIAFSAIYLLSAFKLQETGQVYFIRPANTVGSLIAYKVYIDDQLVCHLKNKHYSLHNVTPGEHTVSIQNAGLGSHKKSKPLKINVVAGKSNYLVSINGSNLIIEETVENSGKDLLEKVVSTKECLTSKVEK